MSGAHKTRLILLRHAKSDWSGPGLADFERPLSKRGRKAAPAVGRWLHDRGCMPDIVISSPAVRAKETVLAVAAELGIPEKEIRFDRRVYEAGPVRLAAVLKEHAADARCALLTGHNPGIEELLLHLCADEPERTADGKLMTAGAVAVLRLAGPGEYGQGSATLEELRRPRDAAEQA